MARMSEHTGLISPYQLLIIAACTNTGGQMKGSHPRPADRCPCVLSHSISQVTSFMQLGMLWSLETLNSGQNCRFFVPPDLQIWWMILENNRAPLLYYVKLCASFQIRRWIQTGVTVRKCSIRVKIGDFFVLCDLEIWQMTLKHNRAPLLCCFKLCASCHSHHWIQTGVTVRKCPIWVKIGDFLSPVTLKFDGWQWKTIGYLFHTMSSFVHHFKAIGEFKLELQSGNAKFRSKSMIFCPLWPWNLTDDLEKQKGTSSMLLQALCIIS